MTERRRRLFRADPLLDMPVLPFPAVLVQFARVFQSATGIIVFSQLAIATPDDTEELM
jgi:hypothetical protein